MTKYNTPTKRNDDVIISALEAGMLYLPHWVYMVILQGRKNKRFPF